MKRIFFQAVIFAGVSLLFSCGGSTEITGDAQADVLQEQDITDVPVDEPADVIDEDSFIVQDPITFVIRNISAGAVYFDFSYGEPQVINASRTAGGPWEDIGFWPPFCMADCGSVGPGEECCVMCDIMMSVKELEGGEDLRVEWDGENLYTVVDDYCTCSCYRAVGVEAMMYEVRVCVFPSFSCVWDPCEADENGVYEGAHVEGPEFCGSVNFDMPYTEAEVVIEVQKEI